MHRALIIDELLRSIFDACYEDDFFALLSTARTCKAWADPALDIIWHRLPSIQPLISLIPNVSFHEGQFELSRSAAMEDLTIFHSYARRVREINCRNTPKLHPTLLDFLMDIHVSLPRGMLPMLKTAHLSTNSCRFFAFSHHLRRIELNLSFKPTPSPFTDSIPGYLSHITEACPDLQQVSVRGLTSQRFNETISSMSTLRILCLRLGTSLTPETMTSIMTFPSLQELEVHAGHLQVLDLARPLTGFPTFPLLNKLSIRSHSTFIQLMLERLQKNNLRSLRIEVEDPIHDDIPWDTLFVMLSKKASASLEDLNIEYLVEIPELDPATTTTLNSSNIPPSHPSRQGDMRLGLSDICHLANLCKLRKFIVDMSLPPLLTDADIDKLVTWWPNLHYLDFGTQLSNQEIPEITSNSLITFAMRSQKLQHLILPIDITNMESSSTTSHPLMDEVCPSRSNLKSLTIGNPSLPNPEQIALRLHKLFPSLTAVYGSCDQDPTWPALAKSLRILQCLG